jgi:hypothetical protein
MILESLLVLGVLIIILLFFYKQAVQEFRILQTDSLEKAMGLLSERSPIVVLPSPTPQQLWTRQDIKQRPTLAKLQIEGLTLEEAIKAETYPLPPEAAEALSQKVGLPVWIQQTLLPTFKQSNWWTPILTNRTEVVIGAQGLRQTYAHCTAIMCTEGAIAVSLLNETANAYLPLGWKGKRVSKMTRDDAPLLAQIQYVDVIVRPGSMLLVPPHWKVCWETHEKGPAAFAVWTEFHHPLSHLVYKASQRR